MTKGLTIHEVPIQLYVPPVHADGRPPEPDPDVDEVPTPHDQPPTGGYL